MTRTDSTGKVRIDEAEDIGNSYIISNQRVQSQMKQMWDRIYASNDNLIYRHVVRKILLEISAAIRNMKIKQREMERELVSLKTNGTTSSEVKPPPYDGQVSFEVYKMQLALDLLRMLPAAYIKACLQQLFCAELWTRKNVNETA